MKPRFHAVIAFIFALALLVPLSPAGAFNGVYRSPESYGAGQLYKFHWPPTDEEMEFVREHLIKLITDSRLSDPSKPVWEAWSEYQRLIEGRRMQFPDDDDDRPLYEGGPSVSFAEFDLNDDGIPERFFWIYDEMYYLGADGAIGAMFHWRDGRWNYEDMSLCDMVRVLDEKVDGWHKLDSCVSIYTIKDGKVVDTYDFDTENTVREDPSLWTQKEYQKYLRPGVVPPEFVVPAQSDQK